MKIVIETKDYGTVITKDVYKDIEHFRDKVFFHHEPFVTENDEMYFFEQIKQAKPLIKED